MSKLELMNNIINTVNEIDDAVRGVRLQAALDPAVLDKISEKWLQGMNGLTQEALSLLKG